MDLKTATIDDIFAELSDRAGLADVPENGSRPASSFENPKLKGYVVLGFCAEQKEGDEEAKCTSAAAGSAINVFGALKGMMDDAVGMMTGD